MNHKKKRIIAGFVLIAFVCAVGAVLVKGMASDKEGFPIVTEEQLSTDAPLDTIIEINEDINESENGQEEMAEEALEEESVESTSSETKDLEAADQTNTPLVETTMTPVIKETAKPNEPTMAAETKAPTSTKTPASIETPAATKMPTSTKTPASTKAPTPTKTTTPTKVPTTTVKPTVAPSVNPTNKPVGTVAFTIDAKVIGLGSVVHNVSVDVYENDTVAHIVDRGLKQKGFSYTNTGSLTKNFYLSSIQKHGLVNNPSVPEKVKEILEDQDVDLNMNKYETNCLGEFHFTRYSGWRYSVNGIYPGVGMSEYDAKDNDNIVIRYTLCLGYDANA